MNREEIILLLKQERQEDSIPVTGEEEDNQFDIKPTDQEDIGNRQRGWPVQSTT